MTLSDTEKEKVREYAAHNPDATVSAVLGRFNHSPDDRGAIEALLDVDAEGGGDEPSSERESGASQPSITPAEHYRRGGMRELYGALGECSGVGLAGGVANRDRWYKFDPHDGPEAPRRGRIMTLSRDWDDLLAAVDRTIYASTSYVPVDWVADSWTPTRGVGGDRVWCSSDGDPNGTKPMPDYDAIAAQALMVDIDLPSDLKRERHCGGEFPQEVVEQALSYTARRFADLAGEMERVFMLDSAGGIYVLIPPAVTAPIVEEFPDDSGVLIDELTDRMNGWLADVESELKGELPALVREGEEDDVLDFDAVNHKSRVVKAPLSVHATYDAVTHPLDPTAPSYDPLPLGGVSEADIDRSREWSEAFTANSEAFREGVGAVVSTLFDGGAWTDVLDNWLAEQERDPTDDRPDAPTPPRPSPDRNPNTTVTAYVQDVQDAVDALDAEQVGKKTIVDSWKESSDDRSGDGLRSFYPTWDRNCNGNANIMNLTEGVWVDTGAGDKGGPAKMALIDAENYSRRGGYATGQDWWRGVQLLRERHGYDIPVYVPPVGSTHSHGKRDRSPLWALCDAAVALGLCRREDLIEREGEDGGTYQDLPTPVYNATLDALEEVGIEHGRDRRGNGEAGKSARAELEEEADEDETEAEKFAREVLVDLLGDT